MKTCKKCGSTDHYADGHCRPCALARLNAKRRENPTLANEKVAEWRKRNPDKVKAYSREYRAANLEKIIAYQRAYNDENREANNMRRRKWRAEEKARLTEAGILPKVRISVVSLGKPCKVCGSNDFFVSSSGNHRECKVCAKARNHSYYTANKERVAARNAEYAADHSEQLRRYRRRWQITNADAVRVQNRNRKSRIRASGQLSRDIVEKLYASQRGLCPCCRQPLGDDYHLDHIIPLSLGGTNTDDNVQLLRAKCNLEKQAKDPITFMQMRGYLL